MNAMKTELTAAEVERMPLVARRGTDGTVIIVARNRISGEMERVEISQDCIKHVRQRLKMLKLPRRRR